jgi:HEAT repeat protein
LLGFLRDDPTRRVQRAWWTLMRVGEPAEAALADCLRSGLSPEARAGAAWVLGRVGGSAADRELAFALDDAHDAVRLPAALMLGVRGSHEAVPALLDILTRGEHALSSPHRDQLRLPGLEAIGDGESAAVVQAGESTGAHESSLSTAPFDDLVESEERALGDDLADFFVWGGNVAGEDDLAFWESPDEFTPGWVISPWCYWLPEELRDAAAISLGRIGDPRAVEALAECVANDDEPVSLRRFAIEALGEIGDAAGFEVVYDSLADEELVDEALSALGGFTDRRALRPLVNAAFGRDIGRVYAVGALSIYAHEATASYLLRLAGDADEFVAEQALRGLARIGTQAALEGVLARLTHVDPGVRRQAAAALGWAQRRRFSVGADRVGTVWHP